jgi:hypothetical protein
MSQVIYVSTRTFGWFHKLTPTLLMDVVPGDFERQEASYSFALVDTILEPFRIYFQESRFPWRAFSR